MKKLLALMSIAMLSVLFMPNAKAYEPWGISIYNGTSSPLDEAVPGATLGTKIGRATCKTVLGVVNWGDCSVRTAMKNGKISRVTGADWEKKYIVVFGKKTLRVYGN